MDSGVEYAPLVSTDTNEKMDERFAAAPQPARLEPAHAVQRGSMLMGVGSVDGTEQSSSSDARQMSAQEYTPLAGQEDDAVAIHKELESTQQEISRLRRSLARLLSAPRWLRC